MADNKDFNKPDIFNRYSDEVLETIKGNIKRIGTFDPKEAVNVPVGFRKLEVLADNFRILKHVGNNKYVVTFDYQRSLQSYKDYVIKSALTEPILKPENEADFTHWVQQTMALNSIYTIREGDITLNITQPTWVNMIIVGPGGSTIRNKQIRYTSIGGSALRDSLTKAGLDPQRLIKVPGNDGTEIPATFTAEEMAELKNLQVAFFRGGRCFGSEGGPSGAVRCDNGVPFKEFNYPCFTNYGFGKGMDMDTSGLDPSRRHSYFRGISTGNGGEYRYGSSASTAGYGGGLSPHGAGGAMLKLRIQLNVGQLNIAKVGGVVVIEPLVWGE